MFLFLSFIQNSSHSFSHVFFFQINIFLQVCVNVSARYGFYMESSGKLQCYACGFFILSVSWQAVVELHAIKSVECPLNTDQAFNVSLEEEKESNSNEASAPSVGSDETDSVVKFSTGSVKKVKNEDKFPRVINDGFFRRLRFFRWSNTPLLLSILFNVFLLIFFK